MKITDVKVYLASEWRSFLFVEVLTDAGISGFGESGLTTRELAVQGAVDHFRPLLLDRSPFDTEKLWQTMARSGFYPSIGPAMAAISAIDIALWDIKAKALEIPLYKLLGGKSRNKLLTYNHLDTASIETLIDHAASSIDQGWKCLRFEPAYEDDHVFEPFKSVSDCVRQWEELRKAVGEDILLCYDAHTRFSLSQAAWLGQQILPYNPYFLEDPIRSDHSHLYRQLRAHTLVPLAAGEQFSGKAEYKDLIENNLIDFARIDLCVGGGITEAMKIAGWCELAGIDIAVHNPVGPVSTAASLHFNLAISNFGVMELPKRPGETMVQAFISDITWEDGYLLPCETPGHGVSLDLTALEEFAFSPTELPHLNRCDGSFTNW